MQSALATSAVEAGSAARPFLKWAGGKRQLLPQLRRFVPHAFGAYHEPFVGSGAVFFDLWTRRCLDDRRARLTDTNADLIGCYRAVVRDVDGLIQHLRKLTKGHARSPAEHYYRVRDRLFNPGRRTWAAADVPGEYPAELAAMFIYLNRTGFNGLFRLNGLGGFNVPAGRYTNPQICDAPALTAAAKALGSPCVELAVASYESVLSAAMLGDFVYFDPPYAPLTTTARFTSYTATGFGDHDQHQLRDVIFALVERGCFVTLSNSTADIIKELYDNRRAVRAGLRAHRVPARRAINSDPTGRGEVMEYIITNVPPVS